MQERKERILFVDDNEHVLSSLKRMLTLRGEWEAHTARGVDEAIRNLRVLCDHADGALVWVDMEGSPYVDSTLEVYRALRQDGAHIGLCLQAYLRRTPEDLDELLPLQPAIRLVKGANLAGFVKVADAILAYGVV